MSSYEYSESYEEEDSMPGTPESYQTGSGGSLPASPGLRERTLPPLRRIASADASLNRKREIIEDLTSATSGVVNLHTSPEAQEDFAPHAPFGTMNVFEAWDTIAKNKRIWFPLPISWRDVPEYQGAGIFFNKFANKIPSIKPDVTRIHEAEPGIAPQSLTECRANVKTVGPKLLKTIQHITVPDRMGLTETEAKLLISEVPPLNPFPSHLLVIEQVPPIRGERVRTTIPIHDVVILCFITKIKLPPRLDPNPLQKGEKIEITVPIARIGIPNPLIFEKLVTYMYSAGLTQDYMSMFDRHIAYAGLPENARMEAATNLPRLLRFPYLNEDEQAAWHEWAKQTEGRLAAQFSMTYSYERLINLMKDANLQVENMIALGFYDPVFQTAILLSRRLMLSAMTLSVVRDHLI